MDQPKNYPQANKEHKSKQNKITVNGNRNKQTQQMDNTHIHRQ